MPTVIDVHAHLVPEQVLEALRQGGSDLGVALVETAPGCACCRFESGVQIRPFFEDLLDVDRRLALMDETGIDRQVLTLWADLFGYDLPAEKGARWHRLLNDALGRVCAANPGRFGWMASVPLQDAARAAVELERVMGAGALGAIVAANVADVNLGECELDEFWAACAALRAPVFIHPVAPVPPARARRFGLAQIVAYTHDTTLAVGSLISAGILDRHPGLELILSHGGGSLPFLIGRFDRMYRAADPAATGTVAAHPPSAYLPRMHYDTILHDGAALRFLCDRVGSERLLLGTDVPFPPRDPDPLASLRAARLSETEIASVAEGNARRLLKI